MQQMIECLNNFHHINVSKMCQKLPKITILTSTILLSAIQLFIDKTELFSL